MGGSVWVRGEMSTNEEEPMRIAYADLEANGLLYEADRIHCLCFCDDKGAEGAYLSTTIEEGVDRLNEYDLVVGHNFMGYDLPLLEKLGYSLTTPIFDTFIESSLFDPDRPYGHSLESYAGMGLEKVANEDWSKLTANMLHRCQEDCKLSQRVYQHHLKELSSWDWKQALEIEQKVSYYHARQVLNGVAFDIDKARKLYIKIDNEIREIEAVLLERIGYSWKRNDPVDKEWMPFKTDGTLTTNSVKWYGDTVWGPSTRLVFEQINLNSYPQIKNYLYSIGWVPDKWNYKKDKLTGRTIFKDGEPVKSNPAITESSMQRLDNELGKMLARYFVLKHRRGFVYTDKTDGSKGGIAALIRSDGRIGADGFPLGTNTRRYRHSGVANVPKAKEDVLYGYEIRDLFTHRQGWILLGTDADSLEARIAGHYTAKYDGGEFAEALLTKDVHSELVTYLKNNYNITMTRQNAKTVYYGISYGLQVPNLAEQLNIDKKQAQKIYNSFWEVNWALAKVKDAALKEWKQKGYLVSIDGGKLFPRSPHSVMNTLFQSAGSIVVKAATIRINERLAEEGLTDVVKQVLHYHDEFTLEVLNMPSLKEKVGVMTSEAWDYAGKRFNLNVAITGSPQFGHSWAEVH